MNRIVLVFGIFVAVFLQSCVEKHDHYHIEDPMPPTTRSAHTPAPSISVRSGPSHGGNNTYQGGSSARSSTASSRSYSSKPTTSTSAPRSTTTYGSSGGRNYTSYIKDLSSQGYSAGKIKHKLKQNGFGIFTLSQIQTMQKSTMRSEAERFIKSNKNRKPIKVKKDLKQRGYGIYKLDEIKRIMQR